MDVARASSTYRPRDAVHSVLHTVIREHLELFLREVSDRGDGEGLPRFVEQEFREFLTCGVLAHGFALVRCERCTFERLVPFSCKGRGFFPSCGGRRIDRARRAPGGRDLAARAGAPVGAHAALPPAVPAGVGPRPVPGPCSLSMRGRCSTSTASKPEATAFPAGRTGTLTVIQRFGGGLNLNVHFHTLALDGVFVQSSAGRLVPRSTTLPSSSGSSPTSSSRVRGPARRPRSPGLRREPSSRPSRR